MSFNNSFVKGLQDGQSAYFRVQENIRAEEDAKRRQAAEARAQQQFDDHQTELRRQRDIQTQTDALRDQLVSPNRGNYSIGTEAQGMKVGARGETGLSPDDAPAPKLAPVLGGEGGTVGMSYNRAPERGAAQEIIGKIAALNGQWGEWNNAQVRKRGFEEDDLFAGKLKEYTGAADQVSSTAQYLNKNSKSISMGTPDKNGFVRMSIVDAAGDAQFLKLTKQDQAKLYAAGHLMETNPTKALEIMAGVNRELAAAVAHENGLIGVLATNANDIAAKSATIDYHNRDLGLKRASADRPNFIQLVNNKGEAVMADARKLKISDDGTLQLPAGMQFPRQAADPKAIEARAAALVGKPTGRLVNGKKEVYDDTTAYEAAVHMLRPGVGSDGGAPAVPAPKRESAEKPPAGGGTFGSHTPKQTAPTVDSRVAAIDARLRLKGIDPQVALGLMQERQRLLGQSSIRPTSGMALQ